MQWACCDNPSVTYAREEARPDGGKREFFICLSCGRSHIVFKDKNGEVTDQQVC